MFDGRVSRTWYAFVEGLVAETRSAAIALDRGDIDLDPRTVSIRRQYIEPSDQLTLGPLKSRAGIRTVSVPKTIIPALREHFDAYVGPQDTDLLFTGERGGVLRRGNFHRGAGRVAAVTKAGAPGRDSARMGGIEPFHPLLPGTNPRGRGGAAAWLPGDSASPTVTRFQCLRWSVDLVAGELVYLRQYAEGLGSCEEAAPRCYGIDRRVPSGEWAWMSLVRRL